MRKNRIENRVLSVAAAAILLMTGCRSNAGSSAETEALKEQIAQLEQQIAVLEQKAADDDTDNALEETPSAAAGGGIQEQAESVSDSSLQPGEATAAEDDLQPDTNAGVSAQTQSGTNAGYGHMPGHDEGYYHNSSHYAGNSSVSNQQSTSADGLTTYTMEELNAMVDAFVAKASAAAPSGTDAQDMEQFFSLKQERKQIDDILDCHEDELESLYKGGSLTKEEYKQLERELDLLEDQLDYMKDQLEYTFGIDD